MTPPKIDPIRPTDDEARSLARTLVAEARFGVGGQARLMLRFLRANGLLDAIRDHDWAAFARAYNGPRYKVHRYDSRIAAAHARYRRGTGDGRGRQTGLLRRGENQRRLDRGEAPLPLDETLTEALQVRPADIIRKTHWPNIDLIGAQLDLGWVVLSCLLGIGVQYGAARVTPDKLHALVFECLNDDLGTTEFHLDDLPRLE